DEVVLLLGRERIAPRKIVERPVDLLEVPRIVELEEHGRDVRLRRGAVDVLGDRLGEGLELALVEEHEPMEDEIFVLAEGHGRPPLLPARGALASVEARAEHPDGDCRFTGHRENARDLYKRLSAPGRPSRRPKIDPW